MIICGIDPGLEGAIAWLTPEGQVIAIADMPILNLIKAKRTSRIVDPYQVVTQLTRYRCGHVFLEVQQKRPGQAAQALEKTFTGYGILVGVIAALGVPLTPAYPRVWKRDLKVPAAKDGARARASELIPAGAPHWPLVKHDGRAEAALIALWGLRSLNSTVR